ncbi:hypothetical protein DFH27DRAFT_308040 [Peziza echinospora]|nr:hypothetical protein DFH27DRAFT_308040 [Peziza echinospora]
MPILRGISCQVHTSYGPLAEYLDPESPDPMKEDAKAAQVLVTRYLDITGTENIPFHIQLAFTEESEWRYPIIVGEVAVDGTALQPYTDICEGPTSSALFTKSEHIQEENGKKRHFEAELYFSKLKIVDSETPGASVRDPKDRKLQELGTIMVRIFRAKNLERTPKKGRPKRPKLTLNKLIPKSQRPMRLGKAVETISAETIEETAMKESAVSHGVTFGVPKEVAAQKQRWGRCSYVDDHENPYITFKFLYRTRVHLENIGIIKIIHVIPDSDEEDDADLAEKSPEEILAELKALRKNLRKRKSDGSEVCDLKGERPKTEDLDDDSTFALMKKVKKEGNRLQTPSRNSTATVPSSSTSVVHIHD